MKKTTVTKRMSFCYGHALPDYAGDCARIHGHNAEVEVTVDGYSPVQDEDIYPGMVVDFKMLKGVMQEVISLLDHQFINELVKEMQGTFSHYALEKYYDGYMQRAWLPEYFPATAENLSRFIFDWINRHPQFVGCVVSVRVSETPDAWATTWREI